MTFSPTTHRRWSLIGGLAAGLPLLLALIAQAAPTPKQPRQQSALRITRYKPRRFRRNCAITAIFAHSGGELLRLSWTGFRGA